MSVSELESEKNINKQESYHKGRGAQFNTSNKYLQHSYVQEHIEMLDEELISNPKTQLIYSSPKTILNKIESPDVGMSWSLNPYQGCEHGCIYCYARNSHEYWGYSAGIDFETKIVVKKEVPKLLEAELSKKTWQPAVVSLSGNTDCYQPIEKKLKITRSLLEVFLKHRNPVGIITKNALILRDTDILQELAKLNLIRVMISITTLNEDLRLKMEPRTATGVNRLKVVKKLSELKIPTGVMVAPVIPGLNSTEINDIIKLSAENGALGAGYQIVRLNGAIEPIFKDWLHKNFPDSYEKVLHQVEDCHGGKVADSRFGVRMKGEGLIAETIHKIFKTAKAKYLKGKEFPTFEFQHFRRNTELSLFD